MKKYLLAAIAAVLVILFAPVGAMCSEFSDVTGSEYYAEAAEKLAEINILEGYIDGRFAAEDNIRRCEIAVVMCKLMGKRGEMENAPYRETFEDVPILHWSNRYVHVAYKAGVINGVGYGKFAPESPVKYEEAVKMTLCSLGFAEGPLSYPDEYLTLAEEKGLLKGLTGSAGQYISRGDVAVLVYNGLIAADRLPETLDEKYKLLILQNKDDRGDASVARGFSDALDDLGWCENRISRFFIQADYYSDTDYTFIKTFMGDKQDLVFCASHYPLVRAMEVTDETPLLFGGVYGPADWGFVDSNEAPGGNLSGIDVSPPVEERISVLQRLCPGIKCVGILVMLGQNNSMREYMNLSEHLSELGIESMPITMYSADEAAGMIREYSDYIDAVYITESYDFLEEDTTKAIIAAANEYRFPVVCINSMQVGMGGLFSVSINTYNLGYRSGVMAVRYLSGEAGPIGTMPIERQSYDEMVIAINPAQAAILGIQIPDDLKQRSVINME